MMLATLGSLVETIPADWRSMLAGALADPSFARLEAFVAHERAEGEVYPPTGDVFAALRLTPLAAVRAVVVGQDPYHGPGQAQGLAFSVPLHQRPPPSLRNILAEWARYLGRPLPADGSLEPWACHGVLLLNTVLTVRRGQAWSHADRGWEEMTGAIIAAVAAKPEPMVFLLWGRQAQRAGARIDSTRHVILSASHPSPRSARRTCGDASPFCGSAPFSQANAELARRRQPPIQWDLEPGQSLPNPAAIVSPP